MGDVNANVGYTECTVIAGQFRLGKSNEKVIDFCIDVRENGLIEAFCSSVYSFA